MRSPFTAPTRIVAVAADSYAKVFVDEVAGSSSEIRNHDYAQLPDKTDCAKADQKYVGRAVGGAALVYLLVTFSDPFLTPRSNRRMTLPTNLINRSSGPSRWMSG